MRTLFATVIAGIIFMGTAIAQDQSSDSHTIEIQVPSVSLLGIEGPGGNTSIVMEFTAPQEIGEWLTAPAPNNDLFLNLTSTAGSSSSGKSVTASISSELPSGISLKVLAANSLTGRGNRGTSAGEVTLSTTTKDVVTGIKSGYTGNGVNNGFQLTYTLDVADTDEAIEAITTNPVTLTVTYTMTEE